MSSFANCSNTKHGWKIKTCEEFEYRGFRFESLGFEQFPAPVAISTPRCPRCEKQLTFRAYVNWHGAVRSKVLCGFCAYRATVGETKEELMQGAHDVSCLQLRK